MSASRYPGLDHPTSSLRGPPSPSPPPQQANANTSNGTKPSEADKGGNGKSPGGGGVKRRAEGEGVRENNANTPSTSRLSSQDPRQQQQNGGSRSPSSSHPSVSNGGANNVEDPAKRRRLVSGSNGPPSSSNKDQHHSSDPTVDFDKPPISPVVLGFNLANTDPGVRDTVRSALRMKEQQQLIIQQRRGAEGSSSAASTPPQASAKTGGDAVAGEGGAPSSSTTENGMDVDVKPAAAPAVEVQVASPALGSGGFSSGGLASRTHEEGRAKAGGLSILTPASADAAQSSPRTGGPPPKPLSARPLVPSQNASQPGAFFPPPQQQQYTPQAGQTPRSASSSSQHQQQQQPSGGPPSSRPSIAPRVPSNGYPSNGGMTPNGGNHHAMPSPAPYGGGQQQQQQQQPPYNPPGSARAAPSASYFGGGGPGQHRPHSPSSPPATQKTTFLAPFERFYDALVDSRTLQQTLSDLSMRSADIHRRGDEEIRRFQHNHQQAANLLNTLQVSSTSLQEMVRKEVAVVREETRREVEVIWKRIRQLEGGFVAAGLPIPPPLPSTTPSNPSPSAPASAAPGPLAPPTGESSRRRSSVVARVGGEGGGKGSASGSGSNRDEEEEDQILDEDSQDEEFSSAPAKARKGTRGGKAGRGASRPPKGVRGARIGG